MRRNASQNPDMPRAQRPARAEDARATGASDARSEVERLEDGLTKRLKHLERQVVGEIIDDARTRGSVSQFLADVTNEARDAGSRLWRSFSDTRTRALRVAEAWRSPHTDESGFDERLLEAFAEALRPAARGWLGLKLRTDIPLPQKGAILIAFNRSAWPLPLEAMVLSAAVSERARRRDVHVLWDPSVVDSRALRRLMRRLGVSAAVPGAARALLEKGALVLCFPEGNAAREKRYAERYRLARFADDFLIGEACAAGVPVVPGGIVGHEESFPVLGRIAGMPLTPMFPLGGVLGLVPLPLGWKVRIGVPVPHDGGAAGDALDALRGHIQAIIGEMVSERRSIVRG